MVIGRVQVKMYDDTGRRIYCEDSVRNYQRNKQITESLEHITKVLGAVRTNDNDAMTVCVDEINRIIKLIKKGGV